MAVGLIMRRSILTTSVFVSSDQDRDKGHDHMFDLLVFHKDSKAQGVLLQLPNVVLCYVVHGVSSGLFMKISSFWVSSRFSMMDSRSSFLKKRMSLK